MLLQSVWKLYQLKPKCNSTILAKPCCMLKYVQLCITQSCFCVYPLYCDVFQ